MTRAGFAAIIGAPNAGKSTLTNRLVGAKVSIVTQKVQTTRFPVRGVAMAGEAQIVLVDTPASSRPGGDWTAPWCALPGAGPMKPKWLSIWSMSRRNCPWGWVSQGR